MDVRQTGRVSDNYIRNKWTSPIIDGITERIVLDLVHLCPVAHFKTRSPAPFDDLLHLPSTFLDGSTPDRVDTWQKAAVFHHEGHQFFGVASDVEKLQTAVENKFSECQVSGQPYPVSMLLELLPQRNKWLDITPRSDDLNDNIEP